MKFLLIVLLIGLPMADGDDYSIRVKIRACSDVKREYNGMVYLLKDGKVKDSVLTNTYVDNFLFSYYKKNLDFKFKNLTRGDYQIKYQNRFNVDSIVNIKLSSLNEEIVQICFDKIPDRFFKETTPLEKLSLGDTLKINCYVAAMGEFGGYDEGIWIVRRNEKYIAAYFSLPNSYGLGLTMDRIAFYNNERKRTKQISKEKVLNEDQIDKIRKFLIEIKYYRTGGGWSNAPEFFSIYSRADTIRKIKMESFWKPYLNLTESIPK